MKRPFRVTALMGCITLAVGGCPPRRAPVRLDPIPMREAAAIVNQNTARIEGTLRATGTVDGSYTLSDGRQRSYHLDGTLFHLAPTYVRFDLKKFGERRILFGSNDEHYWVYTKERDAYTCGLHGLDEDLPPEMPARPDQIIDALGLTWIPNRAAAGDRAGLVQRVVDDYQQILFLIHDDAGAVALEKEYWLDRSVPRLIRRVVFRDAHGLIEMESELNDYEPLAPGGPLLPHVMTAEWPKAGSRMRFRVGRWTRMPQVSPNAIQFDTPDECTDPPRGGP